MFAVKVANPDALIAADPTGVVVTVAKPLVVAVEGLCIADVRVAKPDVPTLVDIDTLLDNVDVVDAVIETGNSTIEVTDAFADVTVVLCL
jgi:hypothetical protein